MNIKSFVIGFLSGVIVLLIIGATNLNPTISKRYDLSTSDKRISILDTQTGIAKIFWIGIYDTFFKISFEDETFERKFTSSSNKNLKP